MLITAFLFGLLGSFHCLGMCGPIAFMLPVDRTNTVKRVSQIVLYHLGRILTYSLIGLVFGLLGKSFYLFNFQQQLSIAVGVLMILIIIIPTHIFNRYNLSKPLYRFISKIKSSLGKELQKKSPDAFFTIGFLNGFLPCGLVYMALFGALASGEALQGSLYMILFGLGTLPLMTVAVYIGNFLTGKVKNYITKAIPVIVVFMGILFIIRGLGLGIPYVSPADINPKVTSEIECH